MHAGATASGAESHASVLAELVVRHTRRHMPTRRVAVEDAFLPAAGVAPGPVLLAAVVAELAVELDAEDRGPVLRLVREARDGLSVPRIALRYRLQTDTHGLDRSRHRVVAEHGRSVLELDTHGRAEPQILGAVLAAGRLGSTGRDRALRAVTTAIHRPGELPEGFLVRRLTEGVRGPVPLASAVRRPPRGERRAKVRADDWSGIPAERRWAMEVLGIRPATGLDAEEVTARFRRLVRRAHPDHGGATVGAAERIAELREARERLLSAATVPNGRR